jgi:hypothetical protein
LNPFSSSHLELGHETHQTPEQRFTQQSLLAWRTPAIAVPAIAAAPARSAHTDPVVSHVV